MTTPTPTTDVARAACIAARADSIASAGVAYADAVAAAYADEVAP